MTSQDSAIAVLFLQHSRHTLADQCWPRLRAAVEPLLPHQIWWRPNPASNSIGNLLLHLNGNVRQWLVDAFSQRQDQRDRPAEFSATGQLSAEALLASLGATIEEASAVLSRLTPGELAASYSIQGYPALSGLEAVYHVVEHFSMHYGQILYIAKTLTAADLGFYSELNRSGRAD